MAQFTDPLAAAVALAQDVGGDLDAILLTHYADAETLDTLRPGGSDLATVAAVNRAVAEELAAQGVSVFVQRADRAAFRRWMDGRDDSAEARRGWIDRTGLLGGAAALRLLGAAVPAEAPRPALGSAPGPLANRLLAAFDREDGAAFGELARELLAAARRDVLDLAIRKISERHDEEAGEALRDELLVVAEAGEFGPAGWAELVALPVALPVRDIPDAVAMGESLVRSGILKDSVEVRFLPGWRAPEVLGELGPVALRQVLLDLVAGSEPRDLPRGDTDDLCKRGFGVLIGLQIDWDIPIWDEIVAAGGLPDTDEDAEEPDEARRAALFDGWREATFDANQGCVPMGLVAASEVAAEIAEFREEASEHIECLDDIRDFLAMARREGGGEEVVCRPEVVGEALELSIYTAGGRFLDSLTLAAARMPARAEEMVHLISPLVRMVKDVPGR